MNLLGTINRILTRKGRKTPPAEISPRYSYRIFWTKQALGWSLDERLKVREDVCKVMGLKDFQPNAYRRVYKLESVDGKKHAGESILTLYNVLYELEQIENQEVENDDTGR